MSKLCPDCGRELPAHLDVCPDDGSPLVVTRRPDTLLGRVLDGRYEVIEQLGSGGMGTVYRAKQQSMQREVAIKVLNRSLAENVTVIKRFFQEAKAASQLTHPGIISLFDFGQDPDGLLYIVMELLTGRALSDELVGCNGLGLERSLALMDQICAALAEAHERDLVHRDLKPDNIFLLDTATGHDVIKLLDFGIAKAVAQDSETAVTATGQVVGTPSYMSPEQGTAGEITAATDVYALGVLLFELLTGRLPYAAETPMALMVRHVHDPIPSVREVSGAPSFSPALDALIQRMMAKDPADRPADAKAVARALGAISREQRATTTREAALSRATEVTPPAASDTTPGQAERASAGGGRRRWLWLGGALVIALGVALVFALPALTGDNPSTPIAGAGGPSMADDGAREPSAPAAEPTQPEDGGGTPSATETDARSARPDVSSLESEVGAEVVVDAAAPAADVGGEPDPAAVAPLGEADAPTPAPEAPGVEEVSLRVTSSPSGARIHLGGELLGTAPVEVRVPASQEASPITASLKGYRTRRAKLRLTADTVQHFKLSRAPKGVNLNVW